MPVLICRGHPISGHGIAIGRPIGELGNKHRTCQIYSQFFAGTNFLNSATTWRGRPLRTFATCCDRNRAEVNAQVRVGGILGVALMLFDRPMIALIRSFPIVMAVAVVEEIATLHKSLLIGFVGKAILFLIIMALPNLWRCLKARRIHKGEPLPADKTNSPSCSSEPKVVQKS